LQEAIARRVTDGEWKPRQALPSESQLGAAYDVSRTVVRQALDGLERAGLIYRIKGRGAFLAERKIVARLLQDPGGFQAQMEGQGLAVRTEVLGQEATPVTGDVAAALGLPEGALALRLERLRFVEGEAVFLGTTYVPLGSATELAQMDFRETSLNTVLEAEYGLRPAGGSRLIEAVAAGSREAELLGVRVGAPLFRLFAVTLGQDGRPMECSQVVLRGDRTAFEVSLNRSTGYQEAEGGIEC
jgi:GntR family transcriptional regulator